jgi:hypothetical protein
MQTVGNAEPKALSPGSPGGEMSEIVRLDSVTITEDCEE